AAQAWACVPDRQLSSFTAFWNRLAFDLHDAPTDRRFRSGLYGVHHQLPQHHRFRALLDLTRDGEVNVADCYRRNLLDVAHNAPPALKFELAAASACGLTKARFDLRHSVSQRLHDLSDFRFLVNV